MKRLFIHFPLFRLLSPFITGALVYTLILLVNNNVEQVEENFMSRELFVCILLSLVIQEFSRGALLLFARWEGHKMLIWKFILQFLASLLISCFIISVSMWYYFDYFIGYSPNLQELIVFNALFGFITIIYFLLYKGHQFLYEMKKIELKKEEEEIARITEEFKTYSAAINVDLLFECMEYLISQKHNAPLAEKFTEEFSSLYRYKLLRRSQELVTLEEELEQVEILLEIYGHLPYQKFSLKLEKPIQDVMVLPGTLLTIVEKIIRTTIPNAVVSVIELTSKVDGLIISYFMREKLQSSLSIRDLKQLTDKYSIYTNHQILIRENEDRKEILLPKLRVYEGIDS